MHAETERRVLRPLFERQEADFIGWDEPSPLRPGSLLKTGKTSYFENWLESARCLIQSTLYEKENVLLVAHSFSCQPIKFLAKEFQDQISGLVLLAPGLDLYSVQKKIIGLSIEDFLAHGSTERTVKVSEMKKHLLDSKSCFDECIQQGLALALENESLFDHYWVNHVAKARYFETLAESHWQLDLDRFFGVLKDYSNHWWTQVEKEKFMSRCLIVLGLNDPLYETACESDRARSDCPFHRAISFKESGHFPQLEEPELFVKEILSF